MPLNLLEPADSTSLAALKDGSVLITGGASGLGESTTRFLAQHGAHVTMVDVKDGTALASQLTVQGQHVQFVHCDITDYNAQIAAFEAAKTFSSSGELDDVLAFAGVDDAGPLVDAITASSGIPPPPSTKALDVNVKGTLYTTTLALHYLRTTTSQEETPPAKSLTLVASMAAYVDDTHNTTYTASKSALRGLIRAVRAAAHSQCNVRVNALAPWAMRTPMTDPILTYLETLGIKAGEGKGITLVEHRVLTDAVGRLVTDAGIWGRSVAVVPEGAVDVGDDFAGGYAGQALRALMVGAEGRADFLHA